MKRYLLTVAFLMVFGTSIASAQNIPPIGPPSGIVPPCGSGRYSPTQGPSKDLPRKPDLIVNVVNPDFTKRMTTKIAFVVDASGSMDNSRRMGMALKFAQNIIGGGHDEMLVALLAFKSSHLRWPGVKHDGIGKPPPKGWAHFPGVPQLESAQAWLNAVPVEGATNPNSAMSEALAEPIRDLTVILITDGDFNGPRNAESFKQTVKDAQALREKNELGRAVIIIIGISASSKKQKHLTEVAKSEGGGFYVIQSADTK